MRRHTNQPPIDRQGRPDESRMLWAGLFAAVIGVLLLIGGLLLPTGVMTRTGQPATERQLVEAFRHGGIAEAPAAPTVPTGQVAATTPAGPQDAPGSRMAASHPTASVPVVDTSVEQACPT